MVNVHRNADISEIYSPASPSSRRYFTSVTQLLRARSKPAFSVIGKIQCSVYVDDAIYLSPFGDIVFKAEISVLNNLALQFCSFVSFIKPHVL